MEGKRKKSLQTKKPPFQCGQKLSVCMSEKGGEALCCLRAVRPGGQVGALPCAVGGDARGEPGCASIQLQL